MSNKLTVNKQQVEGWLSKLPGFDPQDPKPGHYQIFLCPETGAVFHSREQTRAYTKKTQIVDFVAIWVAVQNDGSGSGWKLGSFSSVQPSAAEMKTMRSKVDEYEKRREEAIAREQQRILDEQIEEERLRREREEAAKRDEQNSIEKERREALRKAAEEEKKRKEQEELKAKLASGGAREDTGPKFGDTNNTNGLDRVKVSNFENAYGKWVNDKLTRGGHAPIRIDDMLKEFYDGTVLRKLLSVLTKGEQEKVLHDVSMKPYNKFVVSNNYKIMWDLMTGPEQIDLGGINSVNIWGSHPYLKTLIGLIRKLQQKYDFVGGRSGLLEWVRPRTAKYKQVNNFSSDWSDGTAFLALHDSIFPGQVGPIDSSDPAGNLKKAFSLFSRDLGVVALLEPEDLLGDEIEEELVIMYVNAIKNASEAQTAPAAKNNAAEEGEDLIAKANALKARYTSETKDHMEEIIKQTTWQFGRIKADDRAQVDTLIAEALTNLYDPAEDKFAEVHAVYVQAIEKLQEVDGNQAQPRIDDVTEAIKKSDKIPLDYRSELYDELMKTSKEWKRNALLREGKYVVSVTDEDLSSYIDLIKEYVDRELPKCSSAQDRIELEKSAKSMVHNKGGPGIDIAKEYYAEAKELCEADSDKLVVDSCVSDAEHVLDKYNQEVADYVMNKYSDIAADQEQSHEDMLAMYHQFSLLCAEEIRQLRPANQVEVGPDTAPRRKGAAAYRLEELLEVVKKSYERDCCLRKELHIGTDGLFDAEDLPL